MRQLKSFFFLAAITCLVQVVFVYWGQLAFLGNFWKNIIQVSTTQTFGELQLLSLSLLLLLMTLWVALHANRREILFLAFCAILLLLGASWLTAALHGSFLNPISGVVAILMGVVAVALFERTAFGSREPALRRLFGQRLRPETFRRLVDGNRPVDFPGEMHEASVLVCTIHNHVELMEVLAAPDYVSMMNLYLRTASDFLVDVGGYLDECSGESIRVIFGVPLPDKGSINHGAKAARAAIDLVIRLEELNRECDNLWQKRLDFRIGVNSGAMIAAAYGGARVGRYSVSGPVVEFARHLSAACAHYGCRILAGPASYELASTTVEGRPIDLLQRAGSRRRVELYEFLAPKNSLSSERERSRDQFWKGVIFFRERKWEESINALSSARIAGIPDQVLDYYLERVERARRGEDELTPEQALLSEVV